MNTAPLRTALITGGSRGLGLALARELAHRGWNLIIDARGADALEAARAELAQHTSVIAIPGDVTAEDHRHALLQAAHDLGGLDLLANNASILGPSPQPSLLDYPLDVLEEVYRTNVIGPLALIQEMRDLLKPDAHVINITSDAAVEAYPDWGGYGSAKAALEQLSNILAAERPEWRMYWVDPGDMRTALHQLAFPGEDISDRPPPEESVPGLLALIDGNLPSGRYKARDLAAAESASDQHSVSAASVGTGDSTIVDMRTAMHQEAFPAEDISDRPPPEESVPGLVALLTGDHPSGRYRARALSTPSAEMSPTEAAALVTPQGGIRELRVALTVGDFERSVALYRDGFGLAVVKAWDSPEGRGMVLAAGRGTIELLDHADAEYTDAVEAGRRVSGPVRLALEVADVRATAAALQAQGATVMHAPVQTTWSSLNQRLESPDGMQLSLFQDPSEVGTPE